MSRLLELEAVVEVLGNAFRPMSCEASVSGHGQELAFTVFDRDGTPIVTAPARPALEMREPYFLRLKIEHVRSFLETEGFKLDPFAPPT